MATERHVIEWRDSKGTWQYPGCSEAEATCDTHDAALATIEHLRTTDEDWADANFRITSHMADGVFVSKH